MEYHTKKAADDIDLVQVVRSILLKNGLIDKVTRFYDNHPLILDAVGKNSQVQRFLMNRYWGHQLSMYPDKSMDQRYCLTPNGSVEEWIKLFESSVVPFVVDYNLPTA